MFFNPVHALLKQFLFCAVDVVTGDDWLIKSLEYGYTDGLYCKRLSEELSACNKYEVAVQCLMYAANSDANCQAQATFDLARHYEVGEAVQQSTTKAMKLYGLAITKAIVNPPHFDSGLVGRACKQVVQLDMAAAQTFFENKLRGHDISNADRASLRAALASIYARLGQQGVDVGDKLNIGETVRLLSRFRK